MREIGRRLRVRDCDPRSWDFLAQRLSIAIQRDNAGSLKDTIGPGTDRGGLIEYIDFLTKRKQMFSLCISFT